MRKFLHIINRGVFCVLKYRVSLCKGYSSMEYAALIMSNDGSKYVTKILTRDEAFYIVRQYNMKEIITNEYGCVYEQPERSFKRLFRGKVNYELEYEDECEAF